MAVTSGVFPCYENQFKINTSSSSTATWSTIADCETFEVSFDNGVEEWTPFESEGWVRRLKTAMGVTITVSGKRNVGDTGNDFVSDISLKNGQQAQADFQWTFPDGTVVEFDDAVINVTNNLGGDATNVAPLEFEVLSNGKPTITSA
ncbi:MAG: hypothetical protein IIY21_02865 [Clostridiales bacterium]|nr:hypothetical protein [Clostridiales bacterium]